MTKCYNCGSTNVAIKLINNSCQNSGCSKKITSCVDCRCTKSIYCSDCQKKLTRDISLAINNQLEVIKELDELENRIKSKLTQ